MSERRPRLLDLFCGAGGAAMGYHRAGFEVVGVDIKAQPNYPFEFVQGDALWFLEVLVRKGSLCPSMTSRYWLRDFAAIHASPPCQAFSISRNSHRRSHPELITPTRELLCVSGLPSVIENVEGAPLVNALRVCGLSLGLNVKRHRLFECSFPAMGVPCGDHSGDWLGVYGGTPKRRRLPGQEKRGHASASLGREAMGTPWMTRDENSQAIPPAYTEHIGHYLMAELKAKERDGALGGVAA